MLLTRRNQTYYVRWQIPADIRTILNQGELIISLKTKDRALAVQRSVPYIQLISKIKAARAAYRMKELTIESYQEILRSLWERVEQETPEPPVDIEFAQVKKKVDLHLRMFKERAISDPHFQSERLVDGVDYSEVDSPYQANEIVGDSLQDEIYEKLSEELKRMGVSVGDRSVFFGLAREYWDIHIRRLEKMQELLSLDNYKPKPPAYLKLGAQSNIQAGNPKRLSEAWKDYVKHKQDSREWITQSKIKERQAEFNDFIEILGSDFYCHVIDKEKANLVRAGLLNLPKNRRKHFGNTPLQDIPSDAERISDSTASQRLDNIKGFFRFLVQEEIIDKSPFDNIKISAEKVSYATYTDEDIQELFNLDKKFVKRSWQFWIPRIALYTGARQNEIAQLTIKDIHKDKSSGILFFSINDQGGKSVKTKAGIRRVPIHSDLIKNGFVEYFEKTKVLGNDTDSLWPGLYPISGRLGQTVSRYWTELKNKHKVLSNPTDHQGREKTFHSLRRIVINKLEHHAGVPLYLRQILVGHEVSMGETATYIDFDSLPIEKLADIVEKLNFPQVGWCWDNS